CEGARAVGLRVAGRALEGGEGDEGGAGGDGRVHVLGAHGAADLDERHRGTPTSSARSSGRRMSDVPTRTASAPAAWAASTSVREAMPESATRATVLR